MSFHRKQFLFVVLLALSAPNVGYAQKTYEKIDLNAAIEKLYQERSEIACNPMLDPGCHVPVPGSGGPDGCTDCKPSSLLEALRKENIYILPDSIDIEGNLIQLQQENLGAETLFAVPGQ